LWQATLGSIYRALGNREAALHWYGMGAQQEDANAQNNLGLLLLQGVEPQVLLTHFALGAGIYRER
jgi:TPR repeat protein